MRRIFASVVVAFVCAAPLHAQTSVYSPLSRWQDPLASWETSLMRFEASARPQSSRPELPAFRRASSRRLAAKTSQAAWERREDRAAHDCGQVLWQRF
jgi:hypothetical protein